uniref:Uncharacterized protein n=1 Tax=Leersia perrieri TaxID=77586 RepID=A0A0D9XAM6_9ORYZ
MFRRVTLVWTNLLNRNPASASRSPMQHSNTCNCSSLQITKLFFWNALEMRDNLGISICFDKRCIVESNREVVISLASLNSLTTLQSSLSETTFFTVLLDCFFAAFTKRIVLRRETLLWIDFLNRFLTPVSRSTMFNSSTCNCSFWQKNCSLLSVFDKRPVARTWRRKLL